MKSKTEKIEKRAYQTKAHQRSPLASPPGAWPGYRFGIRPTSGTHQGGIHRLPPFGGSSSLSSAGESPTPRSAPPPLTPYKTTTAAAGTLAPISLPLSCSISLQTLGTLSPVNLCTDDGGCIELREVARELRRTSSSSHTEGIKPR
jgi:hypothetical protein